MADHDDQRLRNAAAAVLLSGLLGTGVQPKTLTTDDDGQRLRNDAAAAFLSELLGIGIQPETLTADDDGQKLRNDAAAFLSGLLGIDIQLKTLIADDDDQRLRTNAAAAFLSELLGIEIQPKTLTNWRAAGKGPKWEYFGLVPVARKGELRRFAREEALQPESTRRRNAEARARERRTALPNNPSARPTEELTAEYESSPPSEAKPASLGKARAFVVPDQRS
jgi:hypothetical protein